MGGVNFLLNSEQRDLESDASLLVLFFTDRGLLPGTLVLDLFKTLHLVLSHCSLKPSDTPNTCIASIMSST